MSTAHAVEMVREKRSPLDVMLRNMWFWDEAAQAMEQRVVVMMDDVQRMEDGEEKTEALAAVRDLVKEFLGSRENAQRCAVDCAPYIHARFQSIMFKDESKQEALVITATLPPTPAQQKADRAYRENYEQQDNRVVPIGE